ncbi:MULTISPECIES: DUF3164 family protein [Methylobacter]
MSELQNTIPAGYMKNALGHLIPVQLISEIDKMRDNLVREIVGKAEELAQLEQDFHDDTFGEIQAFTSLSAETYNVKLGGIKGNITLSSFDGSLQVKLAKSDVMAFNENLEAARVLVDSCIQRWAKDSNINIIALVNHAFQTDQEGKINLGRMYTLMRYEIDDAEWKLAMQALHDSIQPVNTKQYLRIYRRNDKGKMEQLALDMRRV